MKNIFYPLLMTFGDYLPTGIILFLFVPITLLNAQNRQIISLSETYDFDGDGLSEFLSIEKTNDTKPIPDKVAFIEIDDFGNHKEQWSYRFNPGIKDAKIMDVNNDGNPEIAVLSFTISPAGTGIQSPWLYLFEWSNLRFADSPSLLWRASASEYPSNPFNFTSLDFDNDGFNEIAVALGSFSRKILLIEIKDPMDLSSITIDDEIVSPDLSTGFGKIHLFSEDHDGDGDSDLIAVNVEFEKTTIHIFENDRGNFSSSQQHSISNDALFTSDRSQTLTQIPRLISSGASFIDLNNDGKKELVLPFQNGNTSAFEIGSKDIRPAKLSQQEEHWLNVSDKSLGKDDVNEILLARAELGITSQTSGGLKHDIVKGPDLDTNEMKTFNEQFPSDISKQETVIQAPSVPSPKIEPQDKEHLIQTDTVKNNLKTDKIVEILNISKTKGSESSGGQVTKDGGKQSSATGNAETHAEDLISEPTENIIKKIEASPTPVLINPTLKGEGTKISPKDVPNIMLDSQKTDVSSKTQNETSASIIPKKEIIKIETLKPIKTGSIQSTLTGEMEPSSMIEKDINEISGDHSADVISLQKTENIESKPLIEASNQSKSKGQELKSSEQTNIKNAKKIDKNKIDQTKKNIGGSDEKLPVQQFTELPTQQSETGIAEKPVQLLEEEDSITSSPNQKAAQTLARDPSKKTIKLTLLPEKFAKPSDMQKITEGVDTGSSIQKEFQTDTASEKNKTVDFNKSSESSKLKEMNAGNTQPVTASASPKPPIEDTFPDSGTASRVQEYPSIAEADLNQSQSQKIKNTVVVMANQVKMEVPPIDKVELPISTKTKETDQFLGKNKTQTNNAEYTQSQNLPILSSLNASDINLVPIHEEEGNLAEVDNNIPSTYSSSISALNARKGELKAIEKTGTDFAEADYSTYEADPKKMLKLELKSIDINQVKGNKGFLFGDLPKDAFILDTLYAGKTFNLPLEMDDGKTLHSFQPLSMPIGASFNPSARSITWSPMEKQGGYHRLSYLVEYELKDKAQIKEKRGEGVEIVSKLESEEIDLYLYVRENNKSPTSEISP